MPNKQFTGGGEAKMLAQGLHGRLARRNEDDYQHASADQVAEMIAERRNATPLSERQDSLPDDVRD